MTIDDEMFHLRRPIPSEIPNIKNLVLPSFISGELGRDLTFGDLEFAEYLDWFLPRALDDEKALFYVLEFQPLSSFRSYPPRIIGCIYISLSEPLKSSYPFPGMYAVRRNRFRAGAYPYKGCHYSSSACSMQLKISRSGQICMRRKFTNAYWRFTGS